jgi:hypothetical protein
VMLQGCSETGRRGSAVGDIEDGGLCFLALPCAVCAVQVRGEQPPVSIVPMGCNGDCDPLHLTPPVSCHNSNPTMRGDRRPDWQTHLNPQGPVVSAQQRTSHHITSRFLRLN